MNFRTSARRLLFFGLPILSLMAFVSCATTPKIDWASRVDVYTYDQAVTDMGPPQSYAKLTDGSVVAEWLVRHGQTSTYATPMGGYGYGYGYAVPPIIVNNTAPNEYLRLTFGADGRLKAWKKIVR